MIKSYFPLIKSVAFLIAMLLVLWALFPLTRVVAVSDSAQYLLRQLGGIDGWAAVALIADGVNPSSIDTTTLRSASNLNFATDYERRILGITAIGENPYAFASRNWVQEFLDRFYDPTGKKIMSTEGATTDVSVNDDMYGIIALTAAGFSSSRPEIQNAAVQIRKSQNANGSWGYTFGDESTDMTAAAIIALHHSGASNADAAIQNGIAYIKSKQRPDGGVETFRQGISSASATAMVMIAEHTIGAQILGNAGRDFLHSTKQTDGSYKNFVDDAESVARLNPTYFAMIAFSGVQLPQMVSSFQGTSSGTLNTGSDVVTPSNTQVSTVLGSNSNAAAVVSGVTVRIEAPDDTLCDTRAQGKTAKDAIMDAQPRCSITVETQFNAAYNADELTAITKNGKRYQNGSGGNWYLYFVNDKAPSSGLNLQPVQSGDAVVVYYGQVTGWIEMSRIRVSESGENVLAIVEKTRDGVFWGPVDRGAVYVSAGSLKSSYQTDAAGEARFSRPREAYVVFGEAVNMVRTDRFQSESLSDSHEIGLRVDILGSSPTPSNASPGGGNSVPSPNPLREASFRVSTGQIDFGSVRKGETGQTKANVANDGNVDLEFDVHVAGHDIFERYLRVQPSGLLESQWRDAQFTLGKGQNSDITLRLPVPSDYQETGEKQGRFILWGLP